MTHVVIVGGGFAGFACAKKLIHNDSIHVTLIDKHNYHQFTPLLYQVATGEISSVDVATSFRNSFDGKANIDIKLEEVCGVDLVQKSVQTKRGQTYSGDIIVLAVGSRVNFFDTKGALTFSYPLYSLSDAEKLRSKILAAFEDADRNPSLIDDGALNFVIVGAGPTGTELAGALADMIERVLPTMYSDMAVKRACIYLIDHGQAPLGHFSKKSQAYATSVLQKRGVILKLGYKVLEVTDSSVILSDNSTISTRCVVWAGGIKAVELTTLASGPSGRIAVLPDLTVAKYPGIYAIGDIANISDLPQLASVAQQSGQHAALNILSELAGKPKLAFEYNDKGIMAMIGRNAAVAEVGKKHHELEGVIAFAAWLGVHASLLSTMRQRINAFIEWGWNYFGNKMSASILDCEDTTHIDWKG